MAIKGLPYGLEVKNLPANGGDLGFDPWVGKIPGEGNDLENSMDRGAWRATVHGVAESAWTY